MTIEDDAETLLIRGREAAEEAADLFGALEDCFDIYSDDLAIFMGDTRRRRTQIKAKLRNALEKIEAMERMLATLDEKS